MLPHSRGLQLSADTAVVKPKVSIFMGSPLQISSLRTGRKLSENDMRACVRTVCHCPKNVPVCTGSFPALFVFTWKLRGRYKVRNTCQLQKTLFTFWAKEKLKNIKYNYIILTSKTVLRDQELVVFFR